MKLTTKDILFMFVLIVGTWLAMFLFGFQLAKRSNKTELFSKTELSTCLNDLATCKKTTKICKNDKSDSAELENINKPKEVDKIEDSSSDNTEIGVLKTKNPQSEERVPSSLNLKSLSTNMRNKYTVQVGAFKHEYDAQQLTFSLYQKGFKDTYYREVKIIGKGLWYRVGIGFFSKRSSAEVFANMLLNKGNIKSYAIRRL